VVYKPFTVYIEIAWCKELLQIFYENVLLCLAKSLRVFDISALDKTNRLAQKMLYLKVSFVVSPLA